MRLDKVARCLTAITDVANESCLNSAPLGREGRLKEIFIETSLAVSSKKVFLNGILNDFSISIKIASDFGK
jgi:hypothetical protein